MSGISFAFPTARQPAEICDDVKIREAQRPRRRFQNRFFGRFSSLTKVQTKFTLYFYFFCFSICQWWFCFFFVLVSLSPMTSGDLVVLGLALSVSRVNWMKLMILTLMRSSGKKRMTGHSHQPWTLWLGKKLPKLSGRTAVLNFQKLQFCQICGRWKIWTPSKIHIFLSKFVKGLRLRTSKQGVVSSTSQHHLQQIFSSSLWNTFHQDLPHKTLPHISNAFLLTLLHTSPNTSL